LRASEATQQISKKGSRQAPLLLFEEALKAAEVSVTVQRGFFAQLFEDKIPSRDAGYGVNRVAACAAMRNAG
jgi:hypothetical protein